MKSRDRLQVRNSGVDDERAQIEAKDGSYLGRFRCVDLQHVVQFRGQRFPCVVTETVLYMYNTFSADSTRKMIVMCRNFLQISKLPSIPFCPRWVYQVVFTQCSNVIQAHKLFMNSWTARRRLHFCVNPRMGMFSAQDLVSSGASECQRPSRTAISCRELHHARGRGAVI